MKRVIGASLVAPWLAVFLFSLACATLAGAQPARTDWARVRNVAVGDEITVTTAALPPRDCRMAFADDALLVVARPLDRISPVVVDAMRRVGPNWPAILAGRVVVDGTVRIWSGGVQEQGFQVALVEVLPRDEVTEVRRTRKTDIASVLLDVASVSALLVASNATNYTYNKQARQAVGEAPTALVRDFVTLNRRSPVNVRDIIYRTSGDTLPPPMDDAAWQQLLRGLPPSLRGTIK